MTLWDWWLEAGSTIAGAWWATIARAFGKKMRPGVYKLGDSVFFIKESNL